LFNYIALRINLLDEINVVVVDVAVLVVVEVVIVVLLADFFIIN